MYIAVDIFSVTWLPPDTFSNGPGSLLSFPRLLVTQTSEGEGRGKQERARRQQSRGQQVHGEADRA